MWKFRDGDLNGRVLNVVGWLEGGMVSMSTNGTLYLAGSGESTKALYMPGHGQHVDLGSKPPRTLPANGRKKPLFPDAWPRSAIRQVIRRRLKTIVVLSQEALFSELNGTSAHMDAPESKPHATAKDGG